MDPKVFRPVSRREATRSLDIHKGRIWRRFKEEERALWRGLRPLPLRASAVHKVGGKTGALREGLARAQVSAAAGSPQRELGGLLEEPAVDSIDHIAPEARFLPDERWQCRFGDREGLRLALPIRRRERRNVHERPVHPVVRILDNEDPWRPNGSRARSRLDANFRDGHRRRELIAQPSVVPVLIPRAVGPSAIIVVEGPARRRPELRVQDRTPHALVGATGRCRHADLHDRGFRRIARHGVDAPILMRPDGGAASTAAKAVWIHKPHYAGTVPRIYTLSPAIAASATLTSTYPRSHCVVETLTILVVTAAVLLVRSVGSI